MNPKSLQREMINEVSNITKGIQFAEAGKRIRDSDFCCALFMLLLTVSFSSCMNEASRGIPVELARVKKTTTAIEAFKATSKFDRHDPSNIILYEDLYWVFYTRSVRNSTDFSIHIASSDDGYKWQEHGEALGCGLPGNWDESGSIAPYVVPHKGRFYLFYTGFSNGDLDTRELGCAIAKTLRSPWKRWSGNPILRQSPDDSAWDSGMLGDSNLIFREGKWWLYFKSRRKTETSQETHIGVAIADAITGPYRKHPENPLFAGHAVSAWVHRDGVAAICGVISPKIKWAKDGLHFIDVGEMENTSTGLFCPRNFSDGTNPEDISWGLERYTQDGHMGLHRFDCMMK